MWFLAPALLVKLRWVHYAFDHASSLLGSFNSQFAGQNFQVIDKRKVTWSSFALLHEWNNMHFKVKEIV